MEIVNFLLTFNGETIPCKFENDDVNFTLHKFAFIDGGWVTSADLPKRGMLPLYLALDTLPCWGITEGDTVTA